jgi:hypothetical protein
MASRNNRKVPLNFEALPQFDVPQGRNGKHREIVDQILSDLSQIQKGIALRVPLARLTESKAKVRSALNRATRKDGRSVATSSDGDYLYVWNEKTSATKT